MSKTKKITLLITVILLMIGLIVAVAYASRRSHERRCIGFEVILDENHDDLLTTADVSRFINQRNLNPKDQLCDEIDLDNLERELLTMTLVSEAECCLLSNGMMQVKITERRPLFRVITRVSDYCIDTEGHQMLTPSNLPDSTIRVLGDVTIDGAVNEIYPLVRFLYSDHSLASEFRIINVGRGNQVSLRSNRCGYTVIIGTPERYEQCFEKLMTFRRWDANGEYQSRYQSIDLQFRGQIVCKKK